MAQDLYVMLLRPVIVRTFGSFKMVVGDESAKLAKVDDPNWVPMPLNKALGYFKVRFVLTMQAHNTSHR